VLQTLPDREYVSGLGEVVKYGMIRDASLFEYIDRNLSGIRNRDPQVLDEIVHRCAAIKADVVTKDEKESGERAILNYGHTIGHALEAAGNFKTLHHGEAVSIGMEAEAILSMELGSPRSKCWRRQNRVLKLCGLPTRVKKMPEKKVLAALRLDKKNVSGKTRFVLPRRSARSAGASRSLRPDRRRPPHGHFLIGIPFLRPFFLSSFSPSDHSSGEERVDDLESRVRLNLSGMVGSALLRRLCEQYRPDPRPPPLPARARTGPRHRPLTSKAIARGRRSRPRTRPRTRHGIQVLSAAGPDYPAALRPCTTIPSCSIGGG
jgi:hypothetical protein